MGPRQLPTLLVLLLQIVSSWCAPQRVSSARTFLSYAPSQPVPGPEKNYTGFHVRKDSHLVAYYNDQTIAVVELIMPKRELINCEELEVRTKADQDATLKMLRRYKAKPSSISFKDMLDVQRHCQELDTPPALQNNNTSNSSSSGQSTTGTISGIFQGIFPGTKWCGRGDIANSYFDLGEEEEADRCCRTHDLCPQKIAAMRTEYNITNYSAVTRSHCACDKTFFSCLKETKGPLTDLIGTLFFNVGDPHCMDDGKSSSDPKKTVKVFRSNNLKY